MNCQHCQPLLLDHLYGLLDGPEAAAVDAHLASCPACAAARAETARVQGLIARAAKDTFPNTRFEPPVPDQPQPAPVGARTPVPLPKTTVLPFPATRSAGDGAERRPSRTFRGAAILSWAVAAAVLIAIPSTIVPVLDLFDRAGAAAREAEVARHEAEVAVRTVAQVHGERERGLSDAQLKLAVAEQTHTALLNAYRAAQTEAAQTATARKLNIEVRKPATVQPGAPNDFLVVVRDGRERWETDGQRMFAEVHALDRSDAVLGAPLFTQSLDHERRGDTHPLHLPAAAWAQVKPGAELFLVVAQVDEKTGARTELQERVRLAGPVFTTLLVTDKATYRPGERLFFRSLTLDRVTFRPPIREQVLKYELVAPDGRAVSGRSATGTTGLVRLGTEGKVDPVRTANGQPVRGVGCGEFVLPPDLADGDYALVLREQEYPGGPPATVPLPVTRRVQVRAGVVDNYRKQIGFARASFGPGETVEAWAELKDQDKPLPGAAVAVAVQADGQSLEGIAAPAATDEKGRATIRFVLPAELLDGDVRLKVTFRTPHGDEVVAERVPVIGNRVKVEFFPECGDHLVAGVDCKVYVRATTPAGQPVDVRGIVTDGQEELARVESLHDNKEPGANRGLASFVYKPKLGGRAWLKLESPAGVYAPILTGGQVANAAVARFGGPGAVAARTGFPLPPVRSEGVVMTVRDPITGPGEPIRVRLYSVGRPRALVVGAYTRGQLSDTQSVVVQPDGWHDVNLMAGPDPRGGVVRVTLFEELTAAPGEPKPDLKPVAERLVFRKPGELLKLAYTVGGPGAAPLAANSAVQLSIAATDEKGHPAAAVLWAAAVNAGAAPGAKDQLMPTHFLLAGEVKNPDDLEYADFLLTDHPKAGEALDMLLGTQGWRRFVEQAHPPAPANKPPFPNPEMTRLMVQNGQYVTWTEPAPVRDYRKLFETYAPRYEAAAKAVERAKAGLEATRQEMRDRQIVDRATSAAEGAITVATEKAVKAESAWEPVQKFRSGAWYGVGGLAALALCCGALAVARTHGRFPLGFSTIGSVGLAAFLAVAAGWGDDAKVSAAAKVSAVAPIAVPVEPGLPPDVVALAQKAEMVPEPREKPEAQLPAPAMPPAAPAADGVPPAAPKPGRGGAGPGGRSGTAGAERMPAPEAGVGSGGFAKGAAAPAFGGPLKDVPPPFVNPPAQLKDGGRPTPKGMAPFGPPPPPAPGGPPPLGAAGPALTGGGGHTNRSPGVTDAELLANRPSFRLAARGSAGRAPLAEQTDVLKRDGETAARKFATDRAQALAPLVDAARDAVGQQPAPPTVKRFVDLQVRGVVAPAAPLVVREFAAPRPALTRPDEADAPDTVLWQPVLVLPTDGKAVLNFHLGSAPGYQVLIAGHTADGRLGATRGFISVAPAQTPPPPALEPGAPTGSVPPVIPVAPGRPRMP